MKDYTEDALSPNEASIRSNALSDLLSLMTKVKRMYQPHYIVSRVAAVDISTDVRTAFEKALNLIGDIDDESFEFSHILFEPHVLVSTHVLRKAEIGSVLKTF